MKIAVCDDERDIRNNIERYIHILYPNEEVIQFGDGQSLLSCGQEIDIVFLDIQMKGMNGIETARALRGAGSTATIVFVTAIEEYVFQAFDVRAFHYLIKPIEQAKFFEVLKGAIEDRKKNKAIDREEKVSIAVKKGTVTRRIFLAEIIYAEVFNRTVILHMVNENIEFYGKLKELEGSLPGEFVRCHRSYIVNLNYVRRYDAGSVTMDDGTQVPVAKQKYSEFVGKYMQWVQNMNSRKR